MTVFVAIRLSVTLLASVSATVLLYKMLKLKEGQKLPALWRIPLAILNVVAVGSWWSWGWLVADCLLGNEETPDTTWALVATLILRSLRGVMLAASIAAGFGVLWSVIP